MNTLVKRPIFLNVGSIAVGAVIALLTDLGFTFLGSGLGLGGLQALPGEPVGPGVIVGVGLFTTTAMLVSAFIGGYVAGRTSPALYDWEAGLHGLASFGLAAVVMVFLFGSSAALGVGGVLARLGLGPSGVSFVALGLLFLGSLASTWGGLVGLRGALKAARSRGEGPALRKEDVAA
jgi:hypothetical protein